MTELLVAELTALKARVANLERLEYTATASNSDKVDGLHAATSGANAHVVATDASGNATVVGLTATGGVNVGTATGAETGDVGYSGELLSYKNATHYHGYAFVPLATPLTSTSWDGDAKNGTTDNVTIDTSVVFGAPAGVKAFALRMAFIDETVGVGASVGTAGGNSVLGSTQVANVYMDVAGIVPCDANGDFSFASTGELDKVYIQLFGYWI